MNFHDGYTEDDARATFKAIQARLAKQMQKEEYSDEDLLEKYRDGELYQRGEITESLTTDSKDVFTAVVLTTLSVSLKTAFVQELCSGRTEGLNK